MLHPQQTTQSHSFSQEAQMRKFHREQMRNPQPRYSSSYRENAGDALFIGFVGFLLLYALVIFI